MRYLYIYHMGGLYTSDRYLDFDDLRCETCGDTDQFVGAFDTLTDFWDLVKDECDINGSGGYSLQCVYPVVVDNFGLPYEVSYDNENDAYCGFCCNSDEEILRNIHEALKKDYRIKEDSYD